MFDAAATVLEYHERSKHRLDRYAPGPGQLDWANQPNPFREFPGAARLALPLLADSLPTSYDDLRRGRLPNPRPLDLAHIAMLFELSLGLSAWKSYGGNRWALRCNPSSGNLHPTEGYLVCPTLEGIPAGVHHYVSRDHALEHRASIDATAWDETFMGAGVIVGLTSIHWREAWKYGMRAWRYCQQDCGHAIAAVSYAAAALGWRTRMVSGASDEDCARLLGLARSADFQDAEEEAPDVMLWIGHGNAQPDVGVLVERVEAASWHGRANRLSQEHVEWPDIRRVEEATRKPQAVIPAEAGIQSKRMRGSGWVPPRLGISGAGSTAGTTFAKLARQRRSAVDFDGVTSITKQAFFSMLECVMPSSSTPPWNASPGEPLVHPALMVHRVEGLEPGLYILLRDAGALESMKRSMRPEWIWQEVGPAQMPLYFLLPYDLRSVARLICCHQDIGADSCFALGMIARLDAAMREPCRYRELFWECGMLGQVLYLEAEAAGVRATGIGCYFDDEMHRLLGIGDRAWQSLYHFTVGGPVDDRRLLTSPP